MYIKMNDDKSLVITIPTTLYRGDHNADLITFLLPTSYGEMNIADCVVTMGYIAPDGQEYKERLLVMPDMYKAYYQYSTVVDTMLTNLAGEVVIWLVLTDGAMQMSTGETVVCVEPSRDVTEYNPGCGCNGSSAVYVPHIDERKILSWTIEDNASNIPDPVDLNPLDEWDGIDENEIDNGYIWEDM